MRLGRYDQARRGFEKALELSPNMTSATEGLRMADGKQREKQIAEMAGKVLEFQYRNGRRMNKEEVFREANVPYQMLDDVFAFIEQREYVDPSQLSEDEFASLEVQSRTALLMLLPFRPQRTGRACTLSDVYSSLPERDIAQAKRVLGYIEGVNDIDFTYVMPDQETEKLLRTALNMPEEKRNLFSLMEGLNIGVYKARNIMSIINSLKAGERPAPMPRSKGQRAAPATASHRRPVRGAAASARSRRRPDAVYAAERVAITPIVTTGTACVCSASEERELYDTFYPPKVRRRSRRSWTRWRAGAVCSTAPWPCRPVPTAPACCARNARASGKCPRCGFVLGGKVPKRTTEEGNGASAGTPSEPEERDWSRL